jgi:methylase of polypeptide subunit release factors
VYFLRFNVYFLFGVKQCFLYKYSLYFPVFQPRNDSVIFIDLYYNFFNNFFIKFFFEPGIGSGVFIKNLFNFYCLNVLGVDKSYFSLLNFNLVILKKKIKKVCIYNCEWTYVFNSFKSFNFIFCNPPYLSLNDMNFFYFNLIKEYKYSLISKFYGFFDLFYLVKHSYDALLNNGFLFLEHGYLQAKLVRKIMLLSGFINVYTYKDLSNSNRITIGEK